MLFVGFPLYRKGQRYPSKYPSRNRPVGLFLFHHSSPPICSPTPDPEPTCPGDTNNIMRCYVALFASDEWDVCVDPPPPPYFMVHGTIRRPPCSKSFSPVCGFWHLTEWGTYGPLLRHIFVSFGNLGCDCK